MNVPTDYDTERSRELSSEESEARYLISEARYLISEAGQSGLALHRSPLELVLLFRVLRYYHSI